MHTMRIVPETMPDGSKVFAVAISDLDNEGEAVFDCTSEADAMAFYAAVETAIREHTVESLV